MPKPAEAPKKKVTTSAIKPTEAPKKKDSAPVVESEQAVQALPETDRVLSIVAEFTEKKFPRAVRKGDEEAMEVFVNGLCEKEELELNLSTKDLWFLKDF